jgi:MFS family permease
MVSMNNSPEIHFCLVGVLVIATVLLVKGFLVQKDRADTNQPFFTLPDRFLFKLGLIAFSCMICEGTMFDWSGVYFQKVVAVPKAYTTLGYAAFMATMATGRFIGDYIATRLGKQRVLQGSGVLIATGLLLAVILPTISFATIGFLLVGFGVSSVVPLVYSSAGKSSALSPGMALTAVSSIGFLGFLLGPPMIGFIAQSFGLRWSFTVIAFLGLCTTVVASLINWEE